jgi:tetratricopeptide (TPR) repeat protein
MMNKPLLLVVILGVLALGWEGCASSQRVNPVSDANRDLSLQHFLEGSLLDQKEDYAKAILEYQDALLYDKDPAIYYALAKDYSILEKHALAVQMASEAIRLDPNNRTYHEILGGIYATARDFDSALTEYTQIVRIDSQYLAGWQNLARLTQIRKPLKSLEIYQEILNRFGTDWDVYFQMVQIYGSMGKYDKAAAALEGMLALDPGNFEIKKALGDMYLQEDSVEAALRTYGDLVELRPGDPDVRAAIAHAYLVKQDYDNAAEQFEIVLRKDTLSVEEQLKFGQDFLSFIQKDSAVAPYALKLFNKIHISYPADWRPYWFLGAIDNVMKDDSSALENYTKVRELAAWNPDGWVGIASIYYDRSMFDSAIAVLVEAQRYVPEEFRIHFLLGITFQRQHRTVEAASQLEQALQLNNRGVEAMSALGLVYDELNRHADSDTMYERALRIDPHNHLLLNNYGYSLAERGIQIDRALGMSKEAVGQQPSNQSYLDTYGWVLYRMGRYEEAERSIHKAVDLGSTSPVIHEHLGDIYFRLGDKDKAMEFWQKALKFDSANQSLKSKIQRGSL